MDPEVLVRVEGVKKKFCRSLKRSLWYGLIDMASELRAGADRHDRLRKGEFWAVKDVSFELRRGECLGLIGRNGAGKTTLLKMLNGLIKPDAGRITMRGRVGALIALGAGFNPILTGRENIYVNGSVLGLTKREIGQKLEEIIDFADIRDFIDAPVQSYSSGMQVRLGFAVATALKPDILLLDEVLAVGDAAFRARCYNRIGQLQKRAAVIFVSHSMEQISRICTTAMCLAGGKVMRAGEVGQAIQAYGSLNAVGDGESDSFLSLQDHIRAGAVEIQPLVLNSGQSLNVEVQCESEVPLSGCRLRVVFYAEDGALVAEYDSRGPVGPQLNGDKKYTFRRVVGPIHLLGGRYRIGVNLMEIEQPGMLVWSFKEWTVQVNGPVAGLAAYQVTGK